MKKKKTSKNLKLKILVVILVILILMLLGVFLYDKIMAMRMTASLTEAVYEFHQGEYVYLDGHRVIGTIRIDRLEFEYPIILYTGDDALEIAICKYPGPDINELGNVSLLGHNMRTGILFGSLHQLSNGDVVVLTNSRRRSNGI